MGSGHHHRRRSPSPYSDGSSSSGGRSGGHRSHRSHKSHKSREIPRSPPPSYYSGENVQRPRVSGRRPELNRSLSEDTYRSVTGMPSRRESRREPDRGRDGRNRRHHSDDDDEYYYYDKHGRAHNRSLSDSRSRSRSGGRQDRGRSDKTHSSLETFKPIVEDVLAAFGLVSAKHANAHRSSRELERGHNDRDAGSRSSGSRNRAGHTGHHEYVDSMMDPNRMPNTQSAALRAAITAAAMEAFRTRKDFGGMTPERLLRIAGAAIAAGGLDAIVQRDKQAHGKEGGTTRDMIESVIGGMKSSSAFGHRIRRRHGMNSSDQMKYQLMHAATAKFLDRPFGSKDKSLAQGSPRSRSSTRLSSMMRAMTVK